MVSTVISQQLSVSGKMAEKKELKKELGTLKKEEIFEGRNCKAK